MEAAFQALAEPNRRRILELLIRSEELSSGEIATHFHLTPPAVSQHLGVLQHARLVVARRDGARRLYRLREDGFRDLQAFLARFWSDRLARLKTAAESKATEAPHTRPKPKAKSTAKPARKRLHAQRAERRRRG